MNEAHLYNLLDSHTPALLAISIPLLLVIQIIIIIINKIKIYIYYVKGVFLNILVGTVTTNKQLLCDY